jgi:uroporphyrinogen-III synthase
MSSWRLLLTRPADESAALALTLGGAGIFSSSLPLLEIEPLSPSDGQRTLIQDLDHYSAVIVVSKPAARLGLKLVAQVWPQTPLLPWFTVGAGTAQILQEYGLDTSWPENGDDSEALLELPRLQQAIALPGSRVLIMRGEDGRELLAERLRSLGASVDYLPLYKRNLPYYPPSTLSRQVTAERLNAVVVSSGQSLEHFRQLAGDAWPELAKLTLFAPSARVAELARAAGARTVVNCRGASAAALLAALREHPEPAFQAH